LGILYLIDTYVAMFDKHYFDTYRIF